MCYLVPLYRECAFALRLRTAFAPRSRFKIAQIILILGKIVKNKRKPFFEFIKKILRLFKPRPRVINENETLEDMAIYISNHSAASGPLVYELYFPKAIRFWGTHEMCGSLGAQWKYLSTTYYHDKKHLPKWLAKVVATIVCPFVHGFYRGINIIPTYPDSRLRNTLK